MKVAIIGGSGFIGTRLAKRLLERGFSVKIIDKKKSLTYGDLWCFGDVRYVDSIVQALDGVDVIYNLAAEHRDDITPLSLYHDVNVTGAKNVCRAASILGIHKIIFTSSVAVYGQSKGNTDESGELNPVSEYGSTKMLAESVYQTWFCSSFNSSLVIVRPTVVFGEKNRGNVYNLLKQINSGRFLMIGNGKNIKSMAYVENVAAFLEYVLIYEKGEHIFNYIDKPDFDMNQLILNLRTKIGKNSGLNIKVPYIFGLLGGYLFDLLSLVSRRKLPISSVRIKKFAQNTIFSSSKTDDLCFKAPVSMVDGLKQTIEYEFCR